MRPSYGEMPLYSQVNNETHQRCMVCDKPGIDVGYMTWMLLQSVVCNRDSRCGLGVCQQVQFITVEITGQTAR